MNKSTYVIPPASAPKQPELPDAAAEATLPAEKSPRAAFEKRAPLPTRPSPRAASGKSVGRSASAPTAANRPIFVKKPAQHTHISLLSRRGLTLSAQPVNCALELATLDG